MRRLAFKMMLKPGCEKEYKRRHDEIWPQLAEEIRKAGIYDYSIFLDEESLSLFACQKLRARNSSGQLPEKEIMRKWWAYMKDIMETNPDDSPIAVPLKEVFHLD